MSFLFRLAAMALVAATLSAPLSTAASAAAPAPAAAPVGVGVVEFENSGAPAAQAPFLRGLALLHDFEYARAAAAFRQAQAADPGFAMAYWGEAMTYNHAVWQEQDRESARAALARLGPDRAARLAKAGSTRERAWLEAVETLYGDGDKRRRDFAYSDKMKALHGAWPDDVDATAFYALSLLGLAHDGRDLALYMRSAALLEGVFPQHPNHPGVLHYMIHSYDDPIHAPLGLRAARRFGDVAPDAGHALHMTSHIFLALGMWDDVVTMNERAIEVVNRQRAAADRPARHCGHYNEWLVYAYLQRGQVGPADSIVTACRAEAAAELATKPVDGALETYWSSVYSHADIALRRLINTGAWTTDKRLDPPPGKYLWSRLLTAYGDMLASCGDAARLGKANDTLKSIAAAIATATGSREPAKALISDSGIAILLLQANGLERLAAGDSDAGIAALREAAGKEAARPVAFGPPAIPKPSFELLGDELAALGRTDAARAAYEMALKAAPNRRLSGQALDRMARR